jgi:hypothetical protein
LGLSTRIRELIADLREEWQTLNERITAFDAEFVSRARTDEAYGTRIIDFAGCRNAET